MRAKAFVGAIVIVTAGACTDNGVGNAGREPTPTNPVVDAWLVTELPEQCHGFDALFPDGEVTFVKEGRLHSVRTDGVTRCLRDDVESHSIAWGATGDRALLDGRAVTDESRTAVPTDVRKETWSRPTGKAVVYISHDFASLLKIEVGDSNPRDISFLAEHHDIDYHPAGTHLAVSGVDKDGSYGLYLVDNEGHDPHLLARGEDARYIENLHFSHGGRRLYFVATHGTEVHLHELVLQPGKKSGATEQDVIGVKLRTLHVSDKGINSITVSPFSGEIAFESGCQLHVIDRDIPDEPTIEPLPAAGLPARPVGWMPDGSLAYLTFKDRCDESFGDLLLLENDGRTARQIVQGVTAAAVRAPLPPPPKPPEPAEGVVA